MTRVVELKNKNSIYFSFGTLFFARVFIFLFFIHTMVQICLLFYFTNINNVLKCICNENFDFGIFTSSENFIFSDHFDTNLVAKFELEVCEFLV